MSNYETLRREAGARWDALNSSQSPLIYLGTASCGRAAGAMQVLEAIRTTLEELGSDAQVIQVGCIGPCYLEPLMDIRLSGRPRVSYGKVTPQKVPRILQSMLVEGEPLPKLAVGHFGDEAFTDQTGIPRFFDLPMLRPQVRVILKNCGLIDPEDIDHYLAHDGYQGFVKALSMQPEAIIAEVQASGLRGRGGAGFVTGKKWEICRGATGSPKVLICNADEGDPGAFMNRSLLEGDPHAVLEGMLIGGYAIGASHGYVYIRAEYPLAVVRLRHAIAQMREKGLLGENILGSGFSFDITIQEGAGAFVCGEETALIASLEGKRGMPRPRPPYPSDKGFHNLPTLINNTETFGTIPHILRNGGEWFNRLGTPGNAGTKTFSLVGKVRYTGLIEVPLGTTLREIVFEVGGGTEKPFKAVQTGGPLGGCLSAEHLDTPVNYESMQQCGSIMGSGGLIVLDESTCLVDLAHYFLSFAQNESCGKCTPCRIGTRVLVETLEKIIHGQGEPHDLEVLSNVSDTMRNTALCAAGQAAPNPVLSTLKYFRSEYHAHIHDKFCPAAVCKDLFEYRIDAEKCTGCGRCIPVCRSEAIRGEKLQPHEIDVTKCAKCRACIEVCNFDAIQGVPVSSTVERLDVGTFTR
ncbi:MAG: NADH-quinone oxidoreductase subunit NuoF [Anaerolineae bacterium]|nr:NADH-quinone oxidoreductase subunit NuoF [Anaerolineae bacterium]